MRDLPGVLLRDIPRFRRAFAHSGPAYRSHPEGWISLCNRIEKLSKAPDGPGVVCDWQWGSELHAARVLPILGRWLFRAALAEWPIKFAAEPRVTAESPKISFVFAHGGSDRLPQLRRTIQSIFAQVDVPCECVVIDQSETPALGQIPQPAIYRHLDKEGVPDGWHKAWAYNVGARHARGSILVFQDGDVCVPERYAREIISAVDQRGYGAASLQRLLFYLDQEETCSLDSNARFRKGVTPTMAFQNWKGGTIAISKNAFQTIGGFDEGFVDWGGEDDEFYDRCAAIGHCRGGYLPFVHLWHAPQPDQKASTNPNTADVMPWRTAIPHADRIAELRQRRWGEVAAPDPLIGYKAHCPSRQKSSRR